MNVLITRPLNQAHASAARLEGMGMDAFILPLVEIVPLDFKIPRGHFDAVIATSANGFMSNHVQLAAYRQLPLLCVGQQTALAAKKAGFFNIVAITDNVNELVLTCRAYRARHFLYLAGRHRRPVLEQELNAWNRQITVVEIYHQQPIYPTTDKLALLPACFDYVLFYSCTAARHACFLSNFFDVATKFLCLSPRIASALPARFQQQAHSAARPTETSLFELLKI